MKYFIYSKEHKTSNQLIAQEINKVYTPGKVLVSGSYKPFTEIIDTPESRFSDAKIVVYVDELSLINYTDPSYTLK